MVSRSKQRAEETEEVMRPPNDDSFDDTAASSQDPQSQAGGLTKEQILEQYRVLIDSPQRLDEGFEVQSMLRKMPTRIEENSEWFFIPKEWLSKWETYCYVDIINGAGDESDLRNA